jgi:coenzyme F420-reducing hydrogenase alpha subunit
MKNLRYLAILALLVTMLGACSRAINVSEPAKEQLLPGKKVFVMMNAPYAKIEECLDLMPRITRELRELGLTVTSSVTNASTTAEVRTKHQERMYEFQPDYVLTIDLKKPERHEYRNINGTKTVEYQNEYAVQVISKSDGSEVWKTDVHGKKRLIGFYHHKLVNTIFDSMEKAGLIAMKK